MPRLILTLLILATLTHTAGAQTSRRTIERYATDAVKQITLTGRKPTLDILDSLANNAEVSVEMLSRMGEPDDARQSRACLRLIDDIVDYSQTATGRRYVDVVRSGLKKALDRSYEPDVQLHVMQQLAHIAKKGDAAHIAMYLEVPQLAPTARQILVGMSGIDDIIAEAAAAQPGIKDRVKEILDIHAGKKTATTVAPAVANPKPAAVPFWTESLDRAVDDIAGKPADDVSGIIINNKPAEAIAQLLKLAEQKSGSERDAILARLLLTAETTGIGGEQAYLLLRQADALTDSQLLRQRIIVAMGDTHAIQSLSYLRKYYNNAVYADALAVAATETIAAHPEANRGRTVSGMLYAAKQSFIRHYDEQGADTRIDQVLAAIDNWRADGGYNLAHTEETRMEKRGFWVIHDELADFDLCFDWRAEGPLTLSLHSAPALVFDRENGVRIAGTATWHKFDAIGDWAAAHVSVDGERVTVSVNGQKLIDGARLPEGETGEPAQKSGYVKFLADDRGATVREYCFMRR